MTIEADLHSIADIAHRLTAWIQAGAWRHLQDMRHGHPRANTYEPHNSSSDHDPISADIARRNAFDRAAHDTERARREARGALTVLRRLETRLAPYQTAHNTNNQPDLSEWCRPHIEAGDTPRESIRRWRGDLCRPCYERRLDPPTYTELAHHIRTGKWPSTRTNPKHK